MTQVDPRFSARLTLFAHARGRVTWDSVFALILLPAILVILGALWPLVIALNGRPFLHGSTRMKSPDHAFTLWKIRTMRPASDGSDAVLGGSDIHRVTRLGRILRASRLDELPQIFNVLAGDIGFIGPRPPLPQFVSDYPELYRRVLVNKPGITGLATVVLHDRERRILSRCATQEETDAVYRRRCLGIKIRLDLIYQRRCGFGLNVFILIRTFTRLLPKRRGQARKIFVVQNEERVDLNPTDCVRAVA